MLKLSGIANERGILGPHHAYWHPYAIPGVWYDDIRSDRERRPIGYRGRMCRGAGKGVSVGSTIKGLRSSLEQILI